MQRSAVLSVFLVVVLAPSAAALVDYTRDIEPIFHQRCYTCHGESVQTSGLRLDQREGALKGGYSGTVIEPGAADASKLIARVRSDQAGFQMPPSGPRLTAEQIALLSAWIDAGAEWPATPAAPPAAAKSNAGHWSFQPIPRHAGSAKTIDDFILSKLRAENIAPAPEADRVTLARRAYFDLTGIPPTPEQVDRFLGDRRPDAYERLVDELLGSPHYGERRAITWLDAARYADSDGYERDPARPFAWRYRDWVIDAINADMPYDRFAIEQLAGDLVPNASPATRIATGFLRNGVKNREAGVNRDERRFEEVLDRTATTGTVFLGLTVGCAQCHNHKFDPISQREFYQLFAIFNNAVERDIYAPLPGEAGPYQRHYAAFRAAREKIFADNQIPAAFGKWRAKMLDTMDHPGVRTDWDHEVTEWRAAKDRPDWKMRSDAAQLTEIERDEILDWFLHHPGVDLDTAERNAIRAAAKAVDDLTRAFPAMTRAYTMIEREEPLATHIAVRGDWQSPGVEVEPGTLAVLPPFAPAGKPVRLAFAEWLVSEGNPLTARVEVNRIWKDLFGTGIVRTADDFGTQGEAPSHPELLNWLARELIDSGWSRKHIVRLIVTSETYRQSSAARPELAERDPSNRWLARQNRLRLPAELIRDNALAASGLLNPAIGGPSVHPPQPAGIGDLSYSKKGWETDDGPNRYRRGLYIFFQRTSPYPMLITFDAPNTLVAAVDRERSNTPLQALNLMNDPVFLEAAESLAVRTLEESVGTGARLERMFRLALGRSPSQSERERIARFLDDQRTELASEPGAIGKLAPYVPEGEQALTVAAWTGVARALMNLDEFITRE